MGSEQRRYRVVCADGTVHTPGPAGLQFTRRRYIAEAWLRRAVPECGPHHIEEVPDGE